jgi:hypothetical protein
MVHFYMWIAVWDPINKNEEGREKTRFKSEVNKFTNINKTNNYNLAQINENKKSMTYSYGNPGHELRQANNMALLNR